MWNFARTCSYAEDLRMFFMENYGKGGRLLAQAVSYRALDELERTTYVSTVPTEAPSSGGHVQ